ncbi:hypothetical protein J422_01560 [Methanocaldococcus villosus KIN24-T80]|uniref:HTH cro/C1-type domain-containing protein n=1 Tax=Methanocaldococcus villosus KIN24-T80 TaxID=1069083 RepID=N6V2W6_9EURY|nr:multiprotein bridging factor aMBF1 [Methanocaldococcus villosus]ENN96568.1 hypothetical protein J422_01560 [Methanocaldococcus villosus KIN24-T80]
MQMCELCGKLTDKLYKVIIEGSEMMVCEKCKKFGKTPKTYSRIGKKIPTRDVKTEKRIVKRPRRDLFDKLVELREDYGDVIREAREKLGLSIEELARRLKIKATVLQKFERYELEPNEKEIKLLEKELKINLLANPQEETIESSSEEESFTLGHFLKFKK